MFLAGGGDLEAAGEKEPLRSLLLRAGGDLEAALGPGEKDPPRRPRLLFRAGGGDLEPAPGEKEPCRPSLLLRLFLAGGDLDLLFRRRAKRPDPKGTGDLECLIAFLLRGDDADLGEDLDLGDLDLGDLDLGDLERDFRPPIPVPFLAARFRFITFLTSYL